MGGVWKIYNYFIFYQSAMYWSVLFINVIIIVYLTTVKITLAYCEKAWIYKPNLFSSQKRLFLGVLSHRCNERSTGISLLCTQVLLKVVNLVNDITSWPSFSKSLEIGLVTPEKLQNYVTRDRKLLHLYKCVVYKLCVIQVPARNSA